MGSVPKKWVFIFRSDGLESHFGNYPSLGASLGVWEVYRKMGFSISAPTGWNPIFEQQKKPPEWMAADMLCPRTGSPSHRALFLLFCGWEFHIR